MKCDRSENHKPTRIIPKYSNISIFQYEIPKHSKDSKPDEKRAIQNIHALDKWRFCSQIVDKNVQLKPQSGLLVILDDARDWPVPDLIKFSV